MAMLRCVRSSSSSIQAQAFPFSKSCPLGDWTPQQATTFKAKAYSGVTADGGEEKQGSPNRAHKSNWEPVCQVEAIVIAVTHVEGFSRCSIEGDLILTLD